MKIISFRDRYPFPGTVAVAMASDQNVEIVSFAVPCIHPEQRAYAYLQMPAESGSRCDVVELVGNQLSITRQIAAKSGSIQGYIELQDPDGVMLWHSDIFNLVVRALNDLTGEIDQEYPTALQQALQQTAKDREAASASAYAASSSAADSVSSADLADQAKQAAQTAEQEAKKAANASAESANASGAFAGAASDSASAASGAKTDAQRSAQEAAESAEQASTAARAAESASDSAVTEIASKRDEAIAAVQHEADAQKAEIVSKTEESLSRIPEVTQLQEDVASLSGNIGDLSNLETSDKSTLVNAINEAARTGGDSGGVTNVQAATEEEISNRSSDSSVIVPSNLDYAVKAAMTDGKGPAWTEEEKAAARDRIGIDAYTKEEIDAMITAMLDGHADYQKVMRAWFAINGAASMDDLSPLCEKWYTLTRTGWTGGTRFTQPDKSTASTGDKVGDNAGMVCEPSTNTVRGRDDYANLPLFAVVDCNWELDEEGKRHITAIKGIESANPFVTDNLARPVGVIQMAPWCKYEEDENYYSYWFTDQMRTAGFYPIPESVDLDGTIHSWVVHAKYGLGDAYSSIANVPIRVWDVSHNGQRTAIPKAFNANGRYCGKCSCDDTWMKLHVYIKYASLTLDGIMNGCCSYYNANKHPAVAETGVKRIIVTVAEGKALLVGSTICMGTGSYGGKAAQTSVVDRRKITSIEDIEIGGTAYKAVYLDVDAAFDTTVDLIWTTMQWWTGSTDAVLGADGSPYSNTSSKEPYKLQGIEQSYGCYEVMADTILTYAADNGVNVLTFNVCRNATQIATSATAAYKKAGYSLACPEKDSWVWLKKLGHDDALPEVMFGCLSGGSSSTYTKDAVYQLARNSGSYEWLALGDLSSGLSITGLSCAGASSGLGNAYWGIGGRLSANGSRGEWAA